MELGMRMTDTKQLSNCKKVKENYSSPSISLTGSKLELALAISCIYLQVTTDDVTSLSVNVSTTKPCLESQKITKYKEDPYLEFWCYKYTFIVYLFGSIIFLIVSIILVKHKNCLTH
jgi:hypothetical protein